MLLLPAARGTAGAAGAVKDPAARLAHPVPTAPQGTASFSAAGCGAFQAQTFPKSFSFFFFPFNTAAKQEMMRLLFHLKLGTGGFSLQNALRQGMGMESQR